MISSGKPVENNYWKSAQGFLLKVNAHEDYKVCK